jgi:hypothetical protein
MLRPEEKKLTSVMKPDLCSVRSMFHSSVLFLLALVGVRSGSPNSRTIFSRGNVRTCTAGRVRRSLIIPMRRDQRTKKEQQRRMRVIKSVGQA